MHKRRKMWPLVLFLLPVILIGETLAEKIHKWYALNELKIVRSLLGGPSWSWKDAPRPLLFNALSVVSTTRLSTLPFVDTCFEKKQKTRPFFQEKNFKMSVYAIVLVKRTRVVSQLMVPLYGSDDTLKPCVLLEGFSQVSRPDPSWLNTLCEFSLQYKKNKLRRGGGKTRKT